MWQRWNQSTHIFEKSDDNGQNWVPMPLSADIITEGTISASRLPTLEPFPVGSIFISVVSTNPSALLGYGTWSAFATGRMLVGINGADADFDTVEETGGSKTHAHTGPSHTHPVTVDASAALSTGGIIDDGGSVSGGGVGSGSDHHHGIAPHAHTASTTASGTGATSTDSNMPPYVVVYMWKRTA